MKNNKKKNNKKNNNKKESKAIDKLKIIASSISPTWSYSCSYFNGDGCGNSFGSCP